MSETKRKTAPFLIQKAPTILPKIFPRHLFRPIPSKKFYFEILPLSSHFLLLLTTYFLTQPCHKKSQSQELSPTQAVTLPNNSLIRDKPPLFSLSVVVLFLFLPTSYLLLILTKSPPTLFFSLIQRSPFLFFFSVIFSSSLPLFLSSFSLFSLLF